MVTSFPKKNFSCGVLRSLKGRSFPGKRHGISISSCVYLSWVLGTGPDQEAADVPSLLLLIPEEVREQVNVQPRHNRAVEEMSTQGWCYLPCPVNALGSKWEITPQNPSDVKDPFGENRDVCAGVCRVPEMWEALLVCPPACNCTDTSVLTPIVVLGVCSCTWHIREIWRVRGTCSLGQKYVAPNEKSPPNWSPVLGCHISNSLAWVFPCNFTREISQPFVNWSGAGKSHRLPNSTSWDWGGQTNDQLIVCDFQGMLGLLWRQKLNSGYPMGPCAAVALGLTVWHTKQDHTGTVTSVPQQHCLILSALDRTKQPNYRN